MIKLKRYILYVVGAVAYGGYLQALVIAERGAEGGNIHGFTDALWYSFITLTTVGYGDYFPVTPVGKLLSSLLVIASLGVLSYFLGRISLKVYRYMEQKKEGKFGTPFNGHFVIIGWDGFARQVAKQITASGHNVAIITDQKNDLELIRDELPREQTFVLFADYQNYAFFTKVNIEQSTKVFVNFPDDAQALIHTLNLKKAYQDLAFVIILNSSELKDTFRSVGVDYIVSKNEIAANLVASYMFEPDAASLTEDLMDSAVKDEDQDISQYEVVQGNPLLNRAYLEAFAEVKKRYNAVLLGITKASDNKLVMNPSEAYTVEQGDYLILLNSGIAKKLIEKDFRTQEGRIQPGNSA